MWVSGQGGVVVGEAGVGEVRGYVRAVLWVASRGLVRMRDLVEHKGAVVKTIKGLLDVAWVASVSCDIIHIIVLMVLP